MSVFPCHLSARQGGKQSLVLKTNSVTFNAPTTATVLDRGPDMFRDVNAAPFIACLVAESEQEPPAAVEQHARKKQK